MFPVGILEGSPAAQELVFVMLLVPTFGGSPDPSPVERQGGPDDHTNIVVSHTKT